MQASESACGKRSILKTRTDARSEQNRVYDEKLEYLTHSVRTNSSVRQKTLSIGP